MEEEGGQEEGFKTVDEDENRSFIGEEVDAFDS